MATEKGLILITMKVTSWKCQRRPYGKSDFRRQVHTSYRHAHNDADITLMFLFYFIFFFLEFEFQTLPKISRPPFFLRFKFQVWYDHRVLSKLCLKWMSFAAMLSVVFPSKSSSWLTTTHWFQTQFAQHSTAISSLKFESYEEQWSVHFWTKFEIRTPNVFLYISEMSASLWEWRQHSQSSNRQLRTFFRWMSGKSDFQRRVDTLKARTGDRKSSNAWFLVSLIFGDEYTLANTLKAWTGNRKRSNTWSTMSQRRR